MEEESEKQEFVLNYTREHTIAYLLKKMPYNYMIAKQILNEVKMRVPHLKPETILDFGAGLGSGLWGAVHTYED